MAGTSAPCATSSRASPPRPRPAWRSGSTTIKTDVIDAFDLWWPDDAKQRVLWPSTVSLRRDYFDSLMEHAVPLDSRAVARAGAFGPRPRHLRLAGPTPAPDRPKASRRRSHGRRSRRSSARTMTELREFRRKFVQALKTVLTAYPSARIEDADAGLVLRNSPPPVLKTQVACRASTP